MPKPCSFPGRIAAFEQKPSSSPTPPSAPRPKVPKPGNLSQWKPRPPSPPHDTQPENDRNDASMSASDAKESIAKGGSLKERMAMLQGLGALGGGPTAAPPPKPAKKPKWKSPQVAVVPPVAGDDDKGDGAETDNKPTISKVKPPGDDIAAALSKYPQPATTQERQSEVEVEAPVAGEEVPDLDEEEKQRHAAIAARMARLGGKKVKLCPPILGRKPEIKSIKPKSAVPAPETTEEELTIANFQVLVRALRSEDDAEAIASSPEKGTSIHDSNPPNFSKPTCHPHLWFSNDIATFQVENNQFRVHKHFLLTYSSVFRNLFRRQPGSSNTSDNEKRNEDDHTIHLDGVTVLEFESLLTFFYEGWQESFSMPIGNWVALLAITHRFRFKEAEYRARREVFERSISLDPVTRISLAEKHSVPTTFIIPALEDLVRRPNTLLETEIANLSGEMVALLGVARETYMRESSRMFASETWLKRVAHDIVKQVWPTKKY